ncbi:MAG: FG-GAP-like repeat-containing protein [Saprospiraceae bacterium]
MKTCLFACAAALAFGAAVPADAQFFPGKTLFGIQTFFYPTQAADLNVDGFPDLVATRNDDRRVVYWYWNDGQGRFPSEPSDSLDIGFDLFQVVIADLNGDGFPDFATWEYGPSDGPVIWYAGDGQGHFTEQAAQYYDGIPVDDFFAADMDADGDQDLILVEDAIFAVNLRWAANDGQGNFSNPQPIATLPTFASPIHITDINGDGLSDVLVLGIQTLYLNTGAGGFETHNLTTNAGGTFGIGDVEGDGDLDLFAYTGQIGQVALIRNTDDPVPGTFVMEIVPVPGNSPMAAADYDGDGDPDLMMVKTGQWLKNDGTGQFELQDSLSPNLLPGPSSYGPQPTVDFDGDGRQETLLSGYGWAARIGVSAAGGMYSELLVPEVLGTGKVESFDYDGDGDLDIVAASDKLYVFSNQGGGQYGPRQDVAGLSFNPAAIEFADLDGDTDRDILLRRPYDPFNLVHSYWLRNLGGGAYALPNEVLIPNPQLRDLDGDGDMDLLGDPPLQFAENDGNGNFGAPHILSQCTGIPTAADMDGDGDLDIAVFCNTNISVFQNDGAANFSLLQELSPVGPWGLCHWADLDQSGRLDLVVVTDSAVAWSPRQSDGSFGALQTIYQVGLSVIVRDQVRLDDLDGDGDVDIALSLLDDHILILDNDGTGVFSTFYQFNAGILQDLITLDVNGDGALDLLFSTPYTIGWFENVGKRAFIGGVCFWDKNENGQRDPGEAPVQNQALALSPEGKLTFTGPDGKFRLYADSGQFTLSVRLDSCWLLTSDSAVYHRFFDGENNVDGLDFGLQNTGLEKKLTAYLAAGPTRCGAEVGVVVSVHNEACAPALAVFDLFLDSLASFVSAAPPPDSVAPGLLRWQSADTLLPGAAFDILLQLNVAGFEHLGDTLRLLGLVRTPDPTGNPAPPADSVFLSSVINCAYDPNDKLVSRATLPEGYDAAASELVYTVRFQNTGNDLAFNVVVRDPLAPELDWRSFRPLSASHPYSVELDSASRTAMFFFDNIQLPDSLSNEPGSRGLLQFAIRPLASLPPETVIANQAAIYFDFNPPVLTNWAETRVQETLTLPLEPKPGVRLVIMPNPNDGTFAAGWSEPAVPGTVFRIVDLTGRRAMERDVEANEQRQNIEASQLPPGLYFLQVVAGGEVLAAEKFVKY